MSNLQSDRFLDSTGVSGMVATPVAIINGTTPIIMNTQKIEGLAPGTVAGDAVNKAQLDLKANAADVYSISDTDDRLNLKANIADVYAKTDVYD